MYTLIEATLRVLSQRTGGERGQVDALVIALLIFLFILIISGRRLVQ
ncbi:MAG: hypothetical protein ACRDIC_08505 [bacterium]